MTARTLAQVDAIYDVAVRSSLRWEIVDSEPFETFDVAVRSLQHLANGGPEEAFWLEVVRKLRDARWPLSVTPVPFNHPSHQHGKRMDELAALFSRAQDQCSGEGVRLFHDAYLGLQQLACLNDNPLGDRVLELMDSADVGVRGILLPVSRLISPVKEVLRGRPNGGGLKILTPAKLADSETLDILVVVGSTYWYRKYPFVFSAPRALQVYVLKWAWINDAFPLFELLISSRSGARRASGETTPRIQRNSVGAEDLVPRVDWTAIESRVRSAATEVGESVSASVCLLAQGWAVAIGAENDSTVRIIEPSLAGDQRIQEIHAGDIEDGDYLLLRSHGGGELVAALADEELGESAVDLRSKQRAWKSALRAEVRRSGPDSVVRRLKKLGSPRANLMNLRNWQTARFLRTQDRADFNAIMKLVGMGEEAHAVWDAMSTLTNAHRKAGHKITKLLQAAAADADLATLVSTGLMEFHLEGQDVGNLTICRVDAVAPTAVEINEHSLGQRVRAEDLWLA